MSSWDPSAAQRALAADLADQVDQMRAQEAGVSLEDYRDTVVAKASGLTLAQYRQLRDLSSRGPVTLVDWYATRGLDERGRPVSARNDR